MKVKRAKSDVKAKVSIGRIREGICVVGSGNWGSSLAAGVVTAGIPLVEVVVRKKAGLHVGPGSASVATMTAAALDAEVIWICVPDGEIAAVAEAIAARVAARGGDLRGQIVVHSSGALTVDVLAAVKRAGAEVAGTAPVFSFPTREVVSLDGLLFAVETADAGGGLSRKLTELVRRLGGEPLRIRSEKKVMYHAAATMASPLLVSELHVAVATAKLAGLSGREAEAVVRTLASATLENYFEKGSGLSFSGAFARGDVATVELHLQAVAAHPILDGVYRALARNAVESLPVKNKAGFERLPGLSGRVGRVRD